MTMRDVLAPSAPSQAKAEGAWPSVCFHGWKWSLMKTESKPACSASTEKSSNGRGANCSADALYPSLSTEDLLGKIDRQATAETRLRQPGLAQARSPSLWPGKVIVSISALRLLPCGSIARDRVTPPPSAFSITKFRARSWGSS